MKTTLRDLAEASEVRFGTSGVRGLVANMTDALCYAYTQAFLSAVAGDARSVVVGCDLRPSSPRIAAACLQAITDSGRTPIFAGALPTPAAAHYSALNNIPAIIVTGSHIPFDRNGIKFYRADGEIDKNDEQAILDASVTVPENLSPATLPAANPAALGAYIERYTRFFGAQTLAGKRIALYDHSSVARDVLRAILEALGAQVQSLGRTETFVPIDTEAVRQEDIDQATAWAKDYAFDAILSTDGDGDRPLIGDENGTWLRGDIVGVLCAQYVGADIVVTPVSSNTVVEQCGSFRQVVRTRIGSPHVIAGMQAASAADPCAVVVGYEANGGFLLGSDMGSGDAGMTALPTRDATLPMLALLSLATRAGTPLSQLAAGLPARFTASDRIENVASAASHALIAAMCQDTELAAALTAPGAGALIDRNTTDGLRLTFESGQIVHLRPSGNAPELRCYAESDTPAAAMALCQDCLARVATYLREKP